MQTICNKQYEVQNNEYQNKTKKSSLAPAVFISRSVEPSTGAARNKKKEGTIFFLGGAGPPNPLF